MGFTQPVVALWLRMQSVVGVSEVNPSGLMETPSVTPAIRYRFANPF